MTTAWRAKQSRPGAAREGGLITEVLEFVWRRKTVSRAEIARHTGRSRSTISAVVGRLLPTGLIEEVGSGESRGGRRPILMQFRDRASVILGVDIGAAHVSVALTDLRGRTLEWREEDHPVQSDPQGTADLAVRLGKACLATRGNGVPAPMGIGVAVPSPVDPGSPYRILERILPAWHSFDLLGVLRDHFEVPVFVDNDANLGALAEHHWGQAVGIDDFAYLKVATGIGAGLMIDGEIYRGATGVAGEIGHVAIDPRGPECVCGNRGCLATFVGTAPLLSRIQALLPDYPQSVLNGTVADIRALEDAALADDPLALMVVDEAARNLGIVIAAVLNLMNPGSVILGGSLARLGERLLVPLSEAVASRTLVASAAASEVRTSELGPRATALGAATHVLAAALADPSLFPGVRAS